MIKVIVRRDHIEMSGHAMYDDYGKDIVCASASTLLISNVNLIMRFDSEAIKYCFENEKVSIDILKHSKVTDTIIFNMIELLKELEEKYSKNIKIYEEV